MSQFDYETRSIFIMACHRPVDFYWLYECKAIYLLRCMEWSKTFNEVSGHYKNSIIVYGVYMFVIVVIQCIASKPHYDDYAIIIANCLLQILIQAFSYVKDT